MSDTGASTMKEKVRGGAKKARPAAGLRDPSDTRKRPVMMATARDHDRLFIGGDWVTPAEAGRIQVANPSTENLIGSIPDTSPGDIDAAVASACAALDGWSSTPAADRAAALERFADALEKRAPQIAELVAAQNGMPIAIAQQIEAGFPANLARLYAGVIRDTEFVSRRPGALGGEIEVARKPVGVVGAIVPWNFPQTLAATKLMPALATGCTVVLKPCLETALDSVLVAEAAIEAELPPGVLNIVPGGRELGAHLVTHPLVDKIAFTGSTAAGRQIAQTCGQLLRPVSLELGGKSATIVLDDADLTGSVEGLFSATLLNNGQTCFLGTRILAPRARYSEVVDTLAGLASAVKVGDALDADTMIGPMVSAEQRARVEGYIEAGRADGARLVAGGGRPDRPGWFVEPTVFADVRNDQKIAREEIFGPVLAVIAYDDEDEAVAIANDSDFGLGGTVWSTDRDRALAVARQVQTGTIGINRYVPDPAAPFGGVKNSGFGRELGPEAIDGYLTYQSIYL